jgi:PIN domain nuclease of toxin-antitoxin system
VSAPDRRIVLDASAIVDYVIRGRGWETIEKLLPYAVVAVPNLTEALAVIAQKGLQKRSSEQLAGAIQDLGVEYDGCEVADAVRAAELISHSRLHPVGNGKLTLSLGDALCIAVAERRGLPIAGADQLWETLQLKVTFLPYR